MASVEFPPFGPAGVLFRGVLGLIPADQVGAWIHLAHGQPVNVLVRLAALFRVQVVPPARKVSGTYTSIRSEGLAWAAGMSIGGVSWKV